MRKIVGISHRLKRAWLDAVLDRLVQTTDEKELRAFLDEHLREELPGTESRAKATGIILRIWSGVPARARCPSGSGCVAIASDIRPGAHLAALGHDGAGIPVLP